MEHKTKISNSLVGDFKQSIMRLLVLLLIHIVYSGVAFSSIIKQINITESESYGEWTYTTIEFTDSLTILKGSFKATSTCWIGSNRDESLEINGKHLYVIENDLPYNVEQKIYNNGDSINFTYIFEPMHDIVGLNNVIHSRFILPIFFKPNWYDGVAKNRLTDFYLEKSIQSISNGKPYASLRYIEQYYKLSKDKECVTNFLKTHNFHSGISTENAISTLKLAQLFYLVGELEIYQETLIAFDKDYDIFNYVEQVNITPLIEALNFFISSQEISKASPEFVLFSLKLLESTKDYKTASDIALEYINNRFFNEDKTNFFIHDAFLRSLDVDSIQRVKIDQQVKSSIEKIFYKEYYFFMFNRFKNLNKSDISLTYADSLYNYIDEFDRPKYVNEFYEIAENYIKLKKYDKALFYHKAFEKYSLLISPSKQEKEELIDLRLSNSIRFINLSDYTSVVVSTERNKDWIRDIYGENSEEYANNIFYSAIGYNGVGNIEKANECFNIAYNLLKEINPYSTFRIQSIYYLALNSMYEKDYLKTTRLMEDANQLFIHNNNSTLKQKLLRLEIELDLKTNKYEEMYVAMEELQKYLNNNPSIHDETFLNTTQGDFFLDKKMYSASLNMYSANEHLLYNSSMEASSDVFIDCLYNQLNVYFSERTNIQMIHSYAQRLWTSMRKLLLSSINKLSKNERYKIVELYQDKLDLIQKSLILVNTKESNSLLYDILLFRKGLLLSTEIIYNKGNGKEHNISDPLNPEDKCNLDVLQTIEVKEDSNTASLYSWRDIRKKCVKGSIAIEFIAYKDVSNSNIEYYNALIISEDCDAPILIPLGMIPCLLNSTDDIYNSSVLYNNVWRPILNRFENIKEIYFSADGFFHKTAIENIVLPSGILLKQKYNLHRVSSTKILINHFMSNRMSSNVFYGGLLYDNHPQIVVGASNKARSIVVDSPTSIDVLRSGIRYLPGSKHEVESINAQMDSLNISYISFLGFEGTESSFRNLQGTKINILHLATHGFFQDDNSTNSYDFKFLNNAKRQNFDFEDKLLLNSGLFFAFANTSISAESNLPEENDGILTAKDLTQMDFSSTDLVVLSACQTGLGTIKGEGVFGLQRGFKVSGAITLLMSLWPVDDDATQLLMIYFYKNFLNNKTKDESLMIAQNSLRSIAGFEAPEYWAGWILLDALN